MAEIWRYFKRLQASTYPELRYHLPCQQCVN